MNYSSNGKQHILIQTEHETSSSCGVSGDDGLVFLTGEVCGLLVAEGCSSLPHRMTENTGAAKQTPPEDKSEEVNLQTDCTS